MDSPRGGHRLLNTEDARSHPQDAPEGQTQRAVERAVRTTWNQYGKPSSLGELAEPSTAPTQADMDKRYAEVLQEVRVLQAGVQVLLGFLLSMAFTSRFGGLGRFQHNVYVASLSTGAAATALLMAPIAFHQLTVKRALRPKLVIVANRFALAGLFTLFLSISFSLFLVLDVTLALLPAIVITATILSWFAFWWIAVPLMSRRHHESTDVR